MASKQRFLWQAAALALAVCRPALAHDHEGHEAVSEEKLGHVVFPTTCAPAVQAKFESGVGLLHSFEYDRATRRFQEVSAADGDCAMAYWGSAMALYHQIWDDPSEADLAAGWQFVQKAQAARERNAREAAWIEALATFYRPGQRSVIQRTEAYAAAMQHLHETWPADEEATVFDALSLLAAEPPGDTELIDAKKAIALLDEVVRRHPDHPGAAHYLIHACDNPALAAQGLAAARRYAALAPSSPHALHMPSHIFTRLGLWDEDIAANLAAKEAAEQGHAGAEYRLHPMDFLEYAYLQTGQDAKARAIAADAVASPARGYGHGNERYHAYVQAQFPALLALETRDWKAAEALRPPAEAEAGQRSLTYWAQAVGAGHLHDVAAARAAVERLDEDRAAYRKAHPERPVPPVEVRKNEAHAWLLYAQGDRAAAYELLHTAIDYQDRVGKGEVDLPAREMIADMLLDSNRPADALEQYRLSLKTDPNRFNGLYGAARSAELLGLSDIASSYYHQLLANCAAADEPPRADLRHAREALAKAGGAAH